MYKDIRGRWWLTAATAYKYFGIRITEVKKYFYSYEVVKKWM